MTRNLIVLLVAVALIGLLILVSFLSVPRVRSTTPHAYRPLPAVLFSRWPAVPVDAGSRPLVPARAGSTVVPPSILPSGRQTAPSATKPPLALHPPKPTATPVVGGLVPPYVGAKGLAGVATWWDSFGHGMYAAAGPKLRALLGPGYVGEWVTACSGGRCVRVKLITSCACQPDTRLIDLSADAFSQLAPLSVGVIPIEVDHE
jgi:hypothetical protein